MFLLTALVFGTLLCLLLGPVRVLTIAAVTLVIYAFPVLAGLVLLMTVAAAIAYHRHYLPGDPNHD